MGQEAVRFEQRIFANPGSELRYLFAAPAKVEQGVAYPLVLFLHSAGSRGARHGEHIAQIVELLNAAAASHPSYVVAPIVPRAQLWASYGWSTEHRTMQLDPTPTLRATMQLVNQLQAELPIDSRRIYVTGVSMGGYGAWEAIQRWPEVFAAAVPICGGGDPHKADRVMRVPIWAFHGSDDEIVAVNATRDMIDAIRRHGGEPRYTEYPGVNHNAWEPAYREPGLVEWLFSQRRR